MNTKELNEWKRLRKKGKANFIFKYCVPFFGIPYGIIIAFMVGISNEGLRNTFTLKGIIGNGIAGILYGILVGMVVGLFWWKTKEKKWNRYGP